MAGNGAAFADKAASTSKRLLSSAATDNAQVVFDAPCALRTIIGYNSNASGRYLKLYQLDATLAAPDSTKTPFATFYLPPATGFAFDLNALFNFGCGLRITANSADNDTTAISAGDVLGLNMMFA